MVYKDRWTAKTTSFLYSSVSFWSATGRAGCYSTVGKAWAFWSDKPGFKSGLCHLLAVEQMRGAAHSAPHGDTQGLSTDQLLLFLAASSPAPLL